MKIPFRIHRSSRGLTLIELMIAAAILFVILGTVTSLYVFLLQSERRNYSLVKMASDAASLHRALRRIAANGANINADGNSVTFHDSVSGVDSRISYNDADANPATIGNNSIILDVDVNKTGGKRYEIRYVSPLEDPAQPGVALPIFSRTRAATFSAPLLVNFRIGDRSNPQVRSSSKAAASELADATQAERDDAFTGPGFQSLVIRSAFAPRND